MTLGIGAILAGATAAQGDISVQPMHVRIGGTGMALATIRQIGEAFCRTNTDLAVTVLPSLGTAGGLAAVQSGAIDLALAARDLNKAEVAKGLQCVAYARTPVAFVVHPGVPVTTIMLNEVADILAGRRLAWGDGLPVRLIRREPSDADWNMLRGISPGLAEAVRVALERPGLLTVATDQDNADALERLAGAFGAMSIGQLRAEDRHVVPLMLEGVAPTVQALAGGQYTLSRSLYLVWREPASANASRFQAFLRGQSAQSLLAALGHIPLTAHDA